MVICNDWNSTTFLSVVHRALDRHGFYLSDTELQSNVTSIQELGCLLRDQIFPNHFPTYVDITDYQALEEVDPYLWDLLAAVAGIGFLRTALFYLAEARPFTSLSLAAQVGALFNTVSVVLDYIVDECIEPDVVFKIVNDEVLSSIFYAPDEAVQKIRKAYDYTTDQRLRLLLSLLATFAKMNYQLYRLHENKGAWANLAKTLKTIYHAHRKATLTPFPSQAEMADLIPLIKAKSILPALVHLQIARLGSQGHESSVPPEWVEEVSCCLGRIMLLNDDLIDLFQDWQSGAPNSLLIELLTTLSEQAPIQGIDLHIHQVIEKTVKEVIMLLNSPEFAVIDDILLSLYDQAQFMSIYAETPLSVMPPMTFTDFVRLTIGWQTEWTANKVEI